MDFLEALMEPKILLAMLLVSSIQLLAYFGGRAKPQASATAASRRRPHA